MVLLRTWRNLLKALLSKYINAFPDIVTFSHGKKKNPPFIYGALSYTINPKVFSETEQPTSNLSSAHACRLIGELNELLNVQARAYTWHLHLNIPTTVSNGGHLMQNNHQAVLLLWITHPSQPAELPLSKTTPFLQPCMCSMGMFPP